MSRSAKFALGSTLATAAISIFAAATSHAAFRPTAKSTAFLSPSAQITSSRLNLGSGGRPISFRSDATVDVADSASQNQQPYVNSMYSDETFRQKLIESDKDKIYPQKVEIVKSLEPFVEQQIDKYLLDTGEKAWQPNDFLPDMSATDDDAWVDSIKELRKNCQEISDEVLVVLVGDMVTEEALPTYQTLLNTFEGVNDPTGDSESPWAVWSRKWTSEENRHGDLLNKYLYLTGRVDMRSVETTIMHLIASGFNPQARCDPYRGFLYTSFQERATKISHQNVAKMAGEQGDALLGRICATIAGDEARHELAYQSFIKEIMKVDGGNVLLSLADILKGQVVMPAQQMTDGRAESGSGGGGGGGTGNTRLYDNFSEVAQRIGVYTAYDYASIIDHLIKIWNLETLSDQDLGHMDEAKAARDYICRLPTLYRRLADKAQAQKQRQDQVQVQQASSGSGGPSSGSGAGHAFGWIFDRKV